MATNYFRSVWTACSLYIDDRLNYKLFTNEGYWSKPKPISKRCVLFSRESAKATLFIACRFLVHLRYYLGYFLGLKKCVLVLVWWYLGMEVNLSLQAFPIPESKKASFALLREEILKGGPTVPLKTLQRFMGKAL